MSNLTRSAKSANEWPLVDQLAYNITVKTIAPNEFFSSTKPPSLGHLDPNILTANLAIFASPPKEVRNILLPILPEPHSLLDFLKQKMVLSTGFKMPLAICRDFKKSARADVCILYRPTLALFVVTKDKSIFFQASAQPQVVATAISAYRLNNFQRGTRGLPQLDSMTIPCIIMSGSRPTFYLVPVIEELSMSVLMGHYPTTETVVLECFTVTSPKSSVGEGMESPEYRKLALERFLVFKMLAKSHWQPILAGYQ